jgi:hypothetical protein
MSSLHIVKEVNVTDALAPISPSAYAQIIFLTRCKEICDAAYISP